MSGVFLCDGGFNMSWKQPIPTGLEEVFGNDTKGMVLYVFLLLNSANKDGEIVDKGSGRRIEVKRGQSIFGRDRYSKIMGCSPKTAERKLSNICLNSVLKMTKKATPSFTIVTFENYDGVTNMTNKRPTNDQQMTTSKSVKSVKNKEKYKKKVLKHLTKEELLRISKKCATAFSDANQVHNAVWESIESGDKYKVKDVNLTVTNWLRRSIGRGEVEILDKVSLRNDQMLNSPTYKEDLKLLVKQHEDGKPILDFSKVSKKVS